MRKSNHLSFVSIILLSIVLSACQAPTPTPVWPTLTPTVPTPTVTPVPTSTNTPIPTATPTQYPQDPLAWNYENQKVTFIQDGKSYSYYKLTNEQQKIVLEPLAKYWKAMIDEDHVVTINDVNQIVTADAIKDGLINAVNYYQKFNFYTKANAPSLSDSAHYTDWVINGIHDTKGEFIVAVLFNVKDVSLAGYNGTTNQKMTNMAPQDISGKWNFRLAYQDSKWMITQIVTPEKPKK